MIYILYILSCRTTDAHLLAWNKGDVNPTLFCSFYQSGDGSDSALLLGSGGRFHLKFWKLQGTDDLPYPALPCPALSLVSESLSVTSLAISGRCLNPVYPEYDRSFSLSTVLCGAAVGGRFACGSVSGHLFLWTGRKLERAVRAHELGITCIWASAAGALTCSKVLPSLLLALHCTYTDACLLLLLLRWWWWWCGRMESSSSGR